MRESLRMFLFGTFYAESLILAETATLSAPFKLPAQLSPLRFHFCCRCDYTLIGEELLQPPLICQRIHEVGSLKGQDMLKLVIIAVTVIGLLVTISETEFGKGLTPLTESFMQYLK